MVKAAQAFLLSSSVLISTYSFAEVSAQLERNAIEEGETVNLVLSNTEGDLDQVDLAPLAQDFTIVSRSHLSNTSFVNGTLSRRKQLILGLQPKRLGALVIPPLSVAGETTARLSLNVVGAKPVTLEEGGVELLVSASNKQPWVQQPIIYRMTLLLGQPVYNASLAAPEIVTGKALLEPLGKQQQRQQQLKGRTVTVVEQAWIVTPQQSGPLEIKPPRLMATVSDQYRRAKRISATGEQLALTVQGVPDDFQGRAWLPAEEVTLTEQWSEETLRAGEPVTRTITLTVTGVGKAQLPTLVLPESPHIKQYAAQPTFDEHFDGDTLITTLTQQVTVIPEHEGPLELSAITLPWWSVNDQLAHLAQLDRRTLTVAQGVETPQISAPAAPPATPAATLTPEQVETTPSHHADNAVGIAAWVWGGAGLMGGLVIGVLFGCGLSRTARNHKTLPPSQPRLTHVKQLKAHVQTACCANDPAAARAALLKWAVACDASCQTLTMIGEQIPHAAPLLAELNQVLYAANSDAWQGAPLWELLKAHTWVDESQNTSQSNTLSPLYPP